MITVSSDFKNAMKADAKQMAAFLTDGTDPIYGTTDLQTLRIEQKGSLCKTVMRYAKAQFLGSHDYLDKTVSLGIGVVLPNTTTEYITHGNFLVKKQTKSEDTEETTVEMYDLMYESLKKYALTPTYPLTLIEFVQLICTELGWTFDEASFPNSTQIISSELFSDLDVSYRDILDMVAEASGCIIYFGVDNKLHFKQISGTVLETLTLSEQMTLNVESEYGELNSVVLSRSPQEDNIAQQDAESIVTYGLNEFKIVNNVIVDSDRETWITAIFNALDGIKYFPTEVKTVGLGYFEVGDRIEVTDVDTTEKEIVISSIEMVVDGGFSEIIRAEIPTKSVTEYSWAGIIGKQIKNVQIIVNKQAGEIQLLNEAMETVLTVPQQSTPPESPETGDLYLDTDDNIIYRWDGSEWQPTSIAPDALTDYYTKEETEAQINIQADSINASVQTIQTIAQNAVDSSSANALNIETVQDDITELQLDITGLEVSVAGTGGSNLIKNSTGLKGTIEEFQEFDIEGTLIDTDNNGTVVQTSDVEENSESGSAIRIDEQFITQTFPTLVGNQYTFYCRFKKLDDCNLTISGVVGDIPITAGDYVDETWAVFKYSFTATTPNTTIKITNVASGVGSYCILADMVCKIGDVTGWIQAPNEQYGKTFKFDRDGLTITSIEDAFKAILDNVKLGIYDTSSGTDKIMALFSKDAGLVTKLVAQDEFILQRYNNALASTRFIPIETGCMVVVND